MAIIKPSKFLHVGIPVNDLARAKDFYVNVLGLESTDGEGLPSSPHSPVRLHCGPAADPGQQVVLFRRPEPIEARSPEAEGHAHHAFIVTEEEFDLALEKFQEMGLFHRGPITWTEGGHRTLYFFDLDGNYLQLADGDEA
jgi:catechol 2,3-dioxygenase-like lactoylglutathione lyase family enzyme